MISELNNYQFKLVKINNDFIWHKHDDTDEAFIVIEGKMFIELRNETVEINEGEMIVIPKGTEHKPYSKKETKVSILKEKNLETQMIEVYNQALKEFERGDVIYAGKKFSEVELLYPL